MIYALEGLRGIAALAVALFHGWSSAISDFPLIRNASLFVDLFFVISGFVMSHVYGHMKSTGEVWSFATKRFGRLYPLHVFTLFAFIAGEHLLQLFKVLAALLGRSLGTSEAQFDLFAPWAFLSNLLLLQGMGMPGERPYNAPSWSISTEIWTYLVFAATALIPQARLRLVAWLAIIGMAILLWIPSPVDHLFWRCAFGFFIGALLPGLRSSLHPSTRALSVAQLLAGSASMLCIALSREHTDLQFVAPLPFAALVLSLSYDRGLLSRLLKHRTLQRLGQLSYSVYMTHYVVLIFFNPVGQTLGEPYRSILKVIYILLVLGVSVLTYRWIEDPWRRRFQRIANKPRPVVPLGAQPAE